MSIHCARVFVACAAVIVCGPFVAGAQPPARFDPAATRADAYRVADDARYRLRPADTIELDFRFTPEFTQTLLVRPDGYVTLRAIGDTLAAGLTVEEFTRAAEAAYSRLLRNPVISVVLKDFERPYFLVGGEVERPGKFDLRGPTTVVDAVTIAGGIKHSGKETSVWVFKPSPDGNTQAISVDLRQALEEPRGTETTVWVGRGDLVYVPRTVLSKLERFLPVPGMGIFVTPWK